MKHFLFVFLFFGLLYSQAQSQDQIVKIQDRLNVFFQHHPSGRIFLSTDKDVYKPGETIWFSAMAGRLSDPGLSPVSSSLEVSLYDGSGNPVLADNVDLTKGTAPGKLQIPEGSAPGKYILEAHSSSLQEKACMKLIFVDPMNEEEVVLQMLNAPDLLKAGEKNPLEFRLHQLPDKPFQSKRLTYELWAKDKLLTAGKLKTDEAGRVKFDPDVPGKDYGSALELKISDSRNLNYCRSFHVNTEKLKVRFYAEGRNFVAGTPLKIGFHVTNAAGQPVPVTGEVTGDDGQLIAQTATLVPGFGFFSLLAEPGNNYRFHVTSDLGDGQLFDLPAFEKTGFALSVPKTDSLYVHANLVFTDGKAHPVNLLATRGSRLIWASTLNINGAGRVRIPRQDFPDGLCLLSAFDQDEKLIGERLLFLDQPGDLQLSAAVGRQSVKPGQDLDLEISSPGMKDASGVMVVSVSASVKNMDDATGFSPCFAVSSLLENRIPGLRALMRNGSFPGSSLNYLLISNRLKNYSWSSVTEFEVAGMPSGTETSWLAGRVLDEEQEPVQNAKVFLVNRGNAQMMNVTTDEDGHFVFPGINPETTGDYAIKAISPDGNEKLTAELDGTLDQQLTRQVQQYLSFMAFVEKPEIPASFFSDNSRLFSKVRRKKVSEPPKNDSYKQFLRSGSSLMDVIKMIKPYQLVDGDKIVFPGGSNSLMAQDGALIVIDGQKMGTSSSAINSISPSDVESIRISTSPMDILQYTGLNSVGLIEIKTFRGEVPKKTAENVSGLSAGDEFHGNEDQTTLYWSPDLHFDETGMVRLKIPANQVKGEFRISVAAIDEKGQMGEAIKTFRVE